MKRIWLLALAGLWLWGAGAARAQTYIFTNLGELVSQQLGYERCVARDINAKCDVAGVAYDLQGNPRAICWLYDVPTAKWTVKTLGQPFGSLNSEAVAIHDLDGIVGYAEDAKGVRHPFLWDIVNNTVKELPGLAAGTAATACGIERDGYVAGYSFLPWPDLDPYACIWYTPGVYPATALEHSGISKACGIARRYADMRVCVVGQTNSSNFSHAARWIYDGVKYTRTDLSQVYLSRALAEAQKCYYAPNGVEYLLAWFDDHGISRGFLLRSTSVFKLPPLPGAGKESYPNNLNADTVVGAGNGACIWRAPYYDKAINLAFRSFAPPLWQLAQATGITEGGTIVGWGWSGNQEQQAFLLEPHVWSVKEVVALLNSMDWWLQ